MAAECTWAVFPLWSGRQGMDNPSLRAAWSDHMQTEDIAIGNNTDRTSTTQTAKDQLLDQMTVSVKWAAFWQSSRSR